MYVSARIRIPWPPLTRLPCCGAAPEIHKDYSRLVHGFTPYLNRQLRLLRRNPPRYLTICETRRIDILTRPTLRDELQRSSTSPRKTKSRGRNKCNNSLGRTHCFNFP